LGEDCGEGGLGGLDDLTEGDGAGGEGEDAGAVGAGVAECHGEHLDDIIHCNFRLIPRIRRQPQKDPIQTSNAQLQRTNRQRKPSSAARRLQRQLIANIVVIISQIPKSKVGNQRNVDSTEASSSAGGRAISLGGGGGGCVEGDPGAALLAGSDEGYGRLVG